MFLKQLVYLENTHKITFTSQGAVLLQTRLGVIWKGYSVPVPFAAMKAAILANFSLKKAKAPERKTEPKEAPILQNESKIGKH